MRARQEAAARAEKRKAEMEAAAAAARERREEAEREAEAEAEARKYTVKAGDSLSAIARDQLGDMKRWPEIYELNKAVIGNNPDLIQIGMELVLPE